MGWTKKQMREYKREWNRIRRDKVKQSAYYAEYYRKNKLVINQKKDPEAVKRWLLENPLARIAHSEVRKAIRIDLLVRSGLCQSCADPGKRLVAHHEDYLRPLDVVWLYYSCHKRRHAGVQ